MGLFQNDLPVSICPQADNPEGEKFQGRLRGIDSQFIHIFSPEGDRFAGGLTVKVEFRIDENNFNFESTVVRQDAGGLVHLAKPEVIKKSKLREGPRLEIKLPIKFTPWTEEGRFEAETLDVSESGIRMVGRKSLKNGNLISLDLYFKEPRIRVISQGLVAWCRMFEENEYLYESGVQFTTISNETRKKLARYLLDKSKEPA